MKQRWNDGIGELIAAEAVEVGKILSNIVGCRNTGWVSALQNGVFNHAKLRVDFHRGWAIDFGLIKRDALKDFAGPSLCTAGTTCIDALLAPIDRDAGILRYTIEVE